MHNLAMLGENGGKTLMHAQRMGHTVHLSANIFLRHTRTGKFHSRRVHLIAHGTRFFNLRYLQFRFHLTHMHNGHDELHGSRFLLLGRMNA